MAAPMIPLSPQSTVLQLPSFLVLASRTETHSFTGPAVQVLHMCLPSEWILLRLALRPFTILGPPAVLGTHELQQDESLSPKFHGRRPLRSRPSPLLAVGSQEPLSILQTKLSKTSSTGSRHPFPVPLQHPLPPPLHDHPDFSQPFCLCLSAFLSVLRPPHVFHAHCYSWHYFIQHLMISSPHIVFFLR